LALRGAYPERGMTGVLRIHCLNVAPSSAT
jgi:hypothetical protein